MVAHQPDRRQLLRFGLGLLAAVNLFARDSRAAAPQAESEDPRVQQLWRCTFNECDPYFYDPLRGDADNLNGDHPIPPGTAFEDLPDDWLCPICGSTKDYFIKVRRDTGFP